MKIAFVFLVICLAFVSCQTAQKFKSGYRISGPNLNGYLLGQISYSAADKSILLEQDDGYKDLSVYTNDVQTSFKYYSCSGKCEALPIATNAAFPAYYKTANDNCGTTTLAGCTRVCNRNDETDVKSICVDGSDNLEQVNFKDNTVLKITSARTAVPGGAFTPFADCKVTCYAELDIVLAVDESGSISGTYIPSLGVNTGEWSDVREFAIEFIKGFDIGPNKVHMGLVQFSIGARKVLPYPHITSDGPLFTRIVDGLTKKLCTSDPNQWNTHRSCHGATNTGHALIDSIAILQDVSGTRALRRNAGKIVVVVTDGNSWYQGQSSFTYGGQTYTHPTGWVNYAKNSGVTIITVGVGNGIGVAELNSYSSVDPADPSKKLVFTASTFTALKSKELTEALGRTVCTSNGNPAQCGGTACKGSCQCDTCKCPSTCETDNMCMNGQCSASVNTGGGCFFTPVVCSDNNLCTTDTCNPATGCEYTPIVCDDADPCTIDTCNPATGCAHTAKSCDTGNFCTLSDCTPSTGVCTAPRRNPKCDDKNECTITVEMPPGPPTFEPRTDCDKGDGCKIYDCDVVTGCTEEARNCDDGNYCSIDSCVSGNCTYEARDCSDSNACTDDICDPVAEACVNTAFNVTERCDDGNVCTVNSCDPATGCTSATRVCQPQTVDPCIVAQCDPIEGCVDVPKTCEITIPVGAEQQSLDCYVAICDSATGECVSSLTEICEYADLVAAAAAATTLIVVLVIIGAVVCLGATSAGVYAAWSVVGPGDFDNKSGIYEADTQITQNPLAT